MKQTSISAAVRTVAQQAALTVNTDGDTDALNTLTETWDQLQSMKDTMAAGVLQFVTQVEEITNTPVIMSNLGALETEFRRHEEVFYRDIDGFTKKMQELRLQHENRTGPITSMADLTLYNNLAMEYAALNSQLMNLIGPTIASMIMIVNETVPTASAAQNNNITDVEPKNG